MYATMYVHLTDAGHKTYAVPILPFNRMTITYTHSESNRMKVKGYYYYVLSNK